MASQKGGCCCCTACALPLLQRTLHVSYRSWLLPGTPARLQAVAGPGARRWMHIDQAGNPTLVEVSSWLCSCPQCACLVGKMMLWQSYATFVWTLAFKQKKSIRCAGGQAQGGAGEARPACCCSLLAHRLVQCWACDGSRCRSGATHQRKTKKLLLQELGVRYRDLLQLDPTVGARPPLCAARGASGF